MIYSLGLLQQVNLVNLRSGKIQTLPSMITGRQSHASIFWNGFLYVAGGIKSNSFLNTVERWGANFIHRNRKWIICFSWFRFDFDKHSWESVKKMRTTRSHFSMIEAHGRIYAIGGRHGTRCLNTIECYNPMNEAWMDGPSMHMLRCGAGVAVHNDAIYVVGGMSMIDGHDTGTVERFDLQTNKWTMVRMKFGVIACGFKLIGAQCPFHIDCIREQSERSNCMLCVR